MNTGNELRKVEFFDNTFYAASRPTTQDDNFGQIVNRWDLYVRYSEPNNGQYWDMVNGNTEHKHGHLVRYVDGSYCAFFHGTVRIPIAHSQILITEYKG